jgi:hypothetical protein
LTRAREHQNVAKISLISTPKCELNLYSFLDSKGVSNSDKIKELFRTFDEVVGPFNALICYYNMFGASLDQFFVEIRIQSRPKMRQDKP